VLAGSRAAAAVGADRARAAPEDVIFPRSAAEAAAADAADDRPAAFAPGPAPGTPGLLSTAGYLLVFAGLLGGAWFLLKRGRLSRAFGRSEGRLQILETKMLGNRQFLVVVEYDDAKLLLGVGPGRIDYLTPLAGHPLSTGASEVTVPDEPEAAPVPFASKEAVS
jgi:flagellar protein FliO/FliZ